MKIFNNKMILQILNLLKCWKILKTLTEARLMTDDRNSHTKPVVHIWYCRLPSTQNLDPAYDFPKNPRLQPPRCTGLWFPSFPPFWATLCVCPIALVRESDGGLVPSHHLRPHLKRWWLGIAQWVSQLIIEIRAL